MDAELKTFGIRLTTNKYELSKEITKHQEDSYKKSLIQAADPPELIELRAQLLEALGQFLSSDNKETPHQKIRDWAHFTGERASHGGIDLDQALKQITVYRTVIWGECTKELEEKHLSASTILQLRKTLDPILDEICYIFSHVYVEYNKQVIEKAQAKMQELSVPVVTISKDIAILPLIGELDATRSKLLMEIALERSIETKINHLIIDLSGVPIVDTMVANNLYQVISSLKLIGVEATLTGIRPEIAQTLVQLGIRFEDIRTRASLQQTLSEIGL
jgi:rsbT co-antagonist protein RsbR